MAEAPTDLPADELPATQDRLVPAEEPTPTYLRPRFVGSVVVLAIVAGLVLYHWGNSGNVRLTTEGQVASTVPLDDRQVAGAAEPGRREDCPAPGAPVQMEAADLVALFEAAATDGGFDELPVTEEVAIELAAFDPAPPVTRMTRIRGFAGEPGKWSTCVLSTWNGADGPRQSIDVVTVALVAAEDRSDATSGSGSSGTGGSTSGAGTKGDDDTGPAEDRWEVVSWLRGTPEPAPATRVERLAYYNSSRSCRRPDRTASVPVMDGEPQVRLIAVLEELLSGTAGRANTAASMIPPDVQVIDAEIEGGSARVTLSRTSDEDMSRCNGTAAYEQVRDTAAALVAQSLQTTVTAQTSRGRESDREKLDDPEVVVEVFVDGEVVDSLRPGS